MNDPAAMIAARLADLWRQSLPIVLERVAALRSACEALDRDATDAAARSVAREAAHKLSGSLGIFGLPQGTELAAAMEQMLQGTEPLTPQTVALLAQRILELDAVIASKQN